MLTGKMLQYHAGDRDVPGGCRNPGKPYAGLVVHDFENGTVNLLVFTHVGETVLRTDVPAVSAESGRMSLANGGALHCCWDDASTPGLPPVLTPPPAPAPLTPKPADSAVLAAETNPVDPEPAPAPAPAPF